MYSQCIGFFVAGTPVTKGSMTSYAKGRVVDRNAKKLKGWEANIKCECSKAIEDYELRNLTGWDVDGDFEVDVEFYFHRPPTGKLALPRGDVDKYLRAILDGLTGVAYEDDTQVASGSFEKAYCHNGTCEGVSIFIAKREY